MLHSTAYRSKKTSMLTKESFKLQRRLQREIPIWLFFPAGTWSWRAAVSAVRCVFTTAPEASRPTPRCSPTAWLTTSGTRCPSLSAPLTSSCTSTATGEKLVRPVGSFRCGQEAVVSLFPKGKKLHLLMIADDSRQTKGAALYSVCRIYERVVEAPYMDVPEDASFWLGQRNAAHGFFKVSHRTLISPLEALMSVLMCDK